MLSNADLEWMREAIEQLLPDTCVILEAAYTPDGQGGLTQTWGTALSGVACRLDESKTQAREIVAGAALQPFQRWILTLPHGTEISALNRVEAGGMLFGVISVDVGKSWSASVRVTMERASE